MIVSRGSFLKFNHCPGGGSAHDSVRGGYFLKFHYCPWGDLLVIVSGGTLTNLITVQRVDLLMIVSGG